MSSLIVLHSSPLQTSNVKDGLEVALVMAAFEQTPDILLRGAGVQLLSMQTQTDLLFKNPKKILTALELYDIDKLYIEQNDMDAGAFKIDTQLFDALPFTVKTITSHDMSDFYTHYQHVIVF